MIEARSLCKRYGDKAAVAGLDLRIMAGEVYCLLGPNGAGKSTVISLFLGFAAPTSGSASIDGIDIARDPGAARARIAYLPEAVSLYPYLTGAENLAFFSGLAGRVLERNALSEALAAAGLQADVHDRRLSDYSKGMRQKVALAVAWAKHAGAVFLDEPTSGLDPSAARELAQAVRGIAAAGAAVLVATHDLFNARQMASRIGIMSAGCLVADMDASATSEETIESTYLKRIAT